jgi:hypothetical protein
MYSNPNDTPAELRVGVDALVQEQLKAVGAWPTYTDRKGKARRREKILKEQFADVIADKLQETYYNPEIKARMRRHIGVVINLGADITRALACVYKQEPVRSFRDGTEEQNRALIEINEATRWACKAEQINRLAWFAGPVLEVPVIEGGTLTRRVLPCSCIDILVDQSDPLGHPIAAAYPWFEGHEQDGTPRRVIKVIDREHLYTFNKNGEQVGAAIPHGVTEPDGSPRFPGTLWRFDEPLDVSDYYNNDRNERLVDATIECGTIYTTLSWVRKSQNRKVMIAIGSLKDLSASSSMDPEGGGFWNVGDDDAMPSISAVDMSQGPEQFVAQIQFIAKSQIRAFGIPDSALTFDFDKSGTLAVMALSLQHDQLTQLRNKQIRFAHEAETRSQYNLAALCKAAGHPLADALPDLETFAASLEIEFTDLTRIEDPATKQAELDWKLKRGMTTDAHVYQEAHPDLTLEEAKAEVLANLETQAEFNELKANRNMDPAAEMLDGNEATGGMRSDPEPEEDENQ